MNVSSGEDRHDVSSLWPLFQSSLSPRPGLRVVLSFQTLAMWPLLQYQSYFSCWCNTTGLKTTLGVMCWMQLCIVINSLTNLWWISGCWCCTVYKEPLSGWHLTKDDFVNLCLSGLCQLHKEAFSIWTGTSGVQRKNWGNPTEDQQVSFRANWWWVQLNLGDVVCLFGERDLCPCDTSLLMLLEVNT